MSSSDIISKAFDNGAAIAILGFLSWFIAVRLWPFFTDKMWPAWLKQAEARQKSDEEQTSALVKLQTTQGLMVTLLERQVEMLWKLALTLAGVKPETVGLIQPEDIKIESLKLEKEQAHEHA